MSRNLDETTDINGLLQLVQTKIKNNEFSEAEIGLLREDLNSFISHERGLDPEAVKCLFTGWWVRTSLRDNGIDPDVDPDVERG
jgi:hypothetical protein